MLFILRKNEIWYSGFVLNNKVTNFAWTNVDISNFRNLSMLIKKIHQIFFTILSRRKKGRLKSNVRIDLLDEVCGAHL